MVAESVDTENHLPKTIPELEQERDQAREAIFAVMKRDKDLPPTHS